MQSGYFIEWSFLNIVDIQINKYCNNLLQCITSTLPLRSPAAKIALALLLVVKSINNPSARVGLKVNATVKGAFTVSKTSFSITEIVYLNSSAVSEHFQAVG